MLPAAAATAGFLTQQGSIGLLVTGDGNVFEPAGARALSSGAFIALRWIGMTAGVLRRLSFITSDGFPRQRRLRDGPELPFTEPYQRRNPCRL